MTILLLRDSEIFVSTVESGFTTANTTKLSILAGFSMAQESIATTYSTFRQSDTPSRVDARYIKDFSLVDVKFSTYTKITQVSGQAEPADKLLWEAFSNNGTTQSPTSYIVDMLSSNTNVFPDLYIYINTGGAVFKIGKCYISNIDIKFDINGIAMTEWSIKGITYTEIASVPSAFLDRTELTNYIKGRFSKIELLKTIDYDLPLLSGNINIEQSVTRLSTPVVSQALALNPRVVVEGRSVKADVDTYLRTGVGRSLALIESMLTALSTINDTSTITMHLGDTSSKHLSVSMPQALISVPKIDVKAIYTTNMSIFPKETAIGQNDDITLTFYN